MKQLAFAAAATLALALPAAALEAPRKIVDYDIKVSLDPETKLVEGSETLKWTNPSDGPVGELRFHLYWNAFRNDRSTFFKESGGQLRGDKADTGKGWGYTDVTSMKWDGAELIEGRPLREPGRRQPRRPDGPRRPAPPPRRARRDRDARDRVEGEGPEGLRARGLRPRLLLLRPVVPADRRLRAEGPPPPGGARAGTATSTTRTRSSTRTGATGASRSRSPRSSSSARPARSSSETKAGGKKTLTYEQKAVHNFAFTADPRYVVVEDVFDPAKDIPTDELARAAKTLGRSEADLLAGFHKVAIRLYRQPEHGAFDRRHIDAQKWALAWTGLWAFPYPYAQISIVDTPEDGTGRDRHGVRDDLHDALVQVDGALAARPALHPGDGHDPRVHARLLDGPPRLERVRGELDGRGNQHVHRARDGGPQVRRLPRRPARHRLHERGEQPRRRPSRRTTTRSSRTSWKYATEDSYGRNSYPQTGTTIQQIRLLLGEETFWRAFRGYAERWRFDHPTSEDFFDFMRATGNPLVADLIQKTWYGRGWVDFSILDGARRTRTTASRASTTRTSPSTSTPTRRRRRRRSRTTKKHKGPWQSLVTVGRDGDIEMPADVVLTFKDGDDGRSEPGTARAAGSSTA